MNSDKSKTWHPFVVFHSVAQHSIHEAINITISFGGTIGAVRYLQPENDQILIKKNEIITLFIFLSDRDVRGSCI